MNKELKNLMTNLWALISILKIKSKMTSILSLLNKTIYLSLKMVSKIIPLSHHHLIIQLIII
jgi:hypothetical protein